MFTLVDVLTAGNPMILGINITDSVRIFGRTFVPELCNKIWNGESIKEKYGKNVFGVVFKPNFV